MQAGNKAIFNDNIGAKSSVNRSRGRNLDPFWSTVVENFTPLPYGPIPTNNLASTPTEGTLPIVEFPDSDS